MNDDSLGVNFMLASFISKHLVVTNSCISASQLCGNLQVIRNTVNFRSPTFLCLVIGYLIFTYHLYPRPCRKCVGLKYRTKIVVM